MNIAKSVEQSQKQYGDKAALIFEGQTYSYRTLDEMVNRVANGLRQLGVNRGDRVALLLPNHVVFVVAYLAIQKIGAIAVSVNTMLKASEVGFILNDSGATVLVTTAVLLSNVPDTDLPSLRHIVIAEGDAGTHKSLAELMAQASPTATAVTMTADDPAALVYTSGTTGTPKGATLSHGNVLFNSKSKKRYLGIQPDDRMILFVPLFHCFGQNAVLNSGLHAGATIILHRQFEMDTILQSIQQHQVTMFFAVPTIFILILNRVTPESLKPIRYFFSAAAPMPPEIAQAWQQKFGIIINEGYGLTETSPFASYNHPTHYKLGSIGVPIEGVEMKVITNDSQEAAPSELGELVIRGPNVMLGYWNKPTATAAALRDGWFYTGDIGKVDEDGYFYIIDRLKDMINVAGLKVYPTEVENILYQHAAVSETAVYGMPDPITGEKVMAQVVLKKGQTTTQSELFALCREHMAAFKVPSSIKFTDSLPKSRTGKILKRKLRAATHRE